MITYDRLHTAICVCGYQAIRGTPEEAAREGAGHLVALTAPEQTEPHGLAMGEVRHERPARRSCLGCNRPMVTVASHRLCRLCHEREDGGELALVLVERAHVLKTETARPTTCKKLAAADEVPIEVAGAVHLKIALRVDGANVPGLGGRTSGWGRESPSGRHRPKGSDCH